MYNLFTQSLLHQETQEPGHQADRRAFQGLFGVKKNHIRSFYNGLKLVRAIWTTTHVMPLLLTHKVRNSTWMLSKRIPSSFYDPFMRTKMNQYLHGFYNYYTLDGITKMVTLYEVIGNFQSHWIVQIQCEASNPQELSRSSKYSEANLSFQPVYPKGLPLLWKGLPQHKHKCLARNQVCSNCSEMKHYARVFLQKKGNLRDARCLLSFSARSDRMPQRIAVYQWTTGPAADGYRKRIHTQRRDNMEEAQQPGTTH